MYEQKLRTVAPLILRLITCHHLGRITKGKEENDTETAPPSGMERQKTHTEEGSHTDTTYIPIPIPLDGILGSGFSLLHD